MFELKKNTPPQVPPRRPPPRDGKRVQIDGDEVVKFLSLSGVLVALGGLVTYLIYLSHDD